MSWTIIGQVGSVLAAAVHDNLLHTVHTINDAIVHVTFDGKIWNNLGVIGNQKTSQIPDLVSDGTKLHMVHRGRSSRKLWHSIYSNGKWTENVVIPAHTSRLGPSLLYFQAKIHMFHVGETKDQLWHSIYENDAWQPDRKIPNMGSDDTPAVSVFNENIHMAYTAARGNKIYRTVLANDRWMDSIHVNGQLTRSKPLLASTGDKLFMVHTGAYKYYNQYESFLSKDGVFSPIKNIPGISRSAVLIAFQNKLHLFTYGAKGGRGMVHSVSDGII